MMTKRHGFETRTHTLLLIPERENRDRAIVGLMGSIFGLNVLGLSPVRVVLGREGIPILVFGSARRFRFRNPSSLTFWPYPQEA